MKRANIHSKHYNLDYNRFFIIENIDDLHEFFEEKTNGLIKEAAVKLVERARSEIKDKIDKNPIVTYSELIAKNKNMGVVYAECKAMGTYQSNLIMTILRGCKIAIRPSNCVSYFTLCEGDTYEIISEKEIYTKDDIKIMRWPNGYHWYAKIGQIDVVIDGEQKWNAKWEAQEKAEQYLNTILL